MSQSIAIVLSKEQLFVLPPFARRRAERISLQEEQIR